MEYLDFHGEIPAGEYGGGTMTIWDTGTYETEKWHGRARSIVVFHGERARAGTCSSGPSGGRTGLAARRSSDADPAPGREPLPHDARPMLATPGPLPERRRLVAAGRVRRPSGDRAGRRAAAPGSPTPTARTAGGRSRAFAGSARRSGPPASCSTPSSSAARRTCGSATSCTSTAATSLALPFRERRALLEALPLAGAHWRLAPVFPGAGAEVRRGGARSRACPRSWSPSGTGRRTRRATSDADWVEVPPGPRDRPAAAAPAACAAHRVGRAKLTNPDKVLYPLTGTTKSEVLAHYLAVADVMLPHLRDRPVTMVRWPDGVEQAARSSRRTCRGTHRPGSARPGSARPAAVRRRPTSRSSRTPRGSPGRPTSPRWSCTCRSGGSARPTASTCPISSCSTSIPARAPRSSTARGWRERIADRLADNELTSTRARAAARACSSTCRSRVTAPSRRRCSRRRSRRISPEETPGRVTAVMAKARRRGKVFVDWSQNNPYKTTIASYSLRGRGPADGGHARSRGTRCGPAAARNSWCSPPPTCPHGSPSTATSWLRCSDRSAPPRLNCPTERSTGMEGC